MRKRQNKKRSLLKQILIVVILAIVTYFVILEVNAILAIWLGAEVYGNFCVVINGLSLIGLFVLFGMDLAVTRYIPEYFSTHNWSRAFGYLSHNFRFLGFICLGIFALGLTLSYILYLFNLNHILSYERSHPLYLFFWAIPFFAVNTYLSKLLASTHKPYLSLISLNIVPWLLVLVVLYLVNYFEQELELRETVYAAVITLMLVVLGQFTVFYYSIPAKIFKSKPSYESNWKLVAFQLFITNTLSGNNIISIQIILSELFDPVEQNTGRLAAVFIICSIIQFISTAIITLLSPMIAPAVKGNKTKILQLFVNLFCYTLLIAGLLLLGVGLLFGKNILQHFGPTFLIAYPELILFIAGSTISFLTGMAMPILQYSGHQKILLKTTCYGILLLIILSGVMSYTYGVMGSVISTCIVQISIGVYCSFKVRKLFRIKPFVIF